MSANAGRFAALDGWRGVLALCVMSLHYGWPGGVLHPSRGGLSVDVFFLLSGFVLTHAFDAKFASGAISGWGFFIARAKRLLPLHLIVLGAVILFAYGELYGDMLNQFYGDNIEVQNSLAAVPYIIWDALLLTQFPASFLAGMKEVALNGVTWSISGELWLGLVLILVLGRKGWKPVALAAAIGVAAYLVLFFSTGSIKDYLKPLGPFYTGDYRAIGGFLLGFATYRVFAVAGPRIKNLPVALLWIAEIGVTAATVALLWGHGGWTDILMVPVGLALLLTFAASRGPVSWILTRGPFQILGALSFHIYLWHQPVHHFMVSQDTEEWSVAATLIMSAITWLLLDGGFVKAALAMLKHQPRLQQPQPALSPSSPAHS